MLPACEEWRFVEYFAGEANVSAELRMASYRGVSMDVTYGGKAMDLLTAPGMGPLAEAKRVVDGSGWHCLRC